MTDHEHHLDHIDDRAELEARIREDREGGFVAVPAGTDPVEWVQSDLADREHELDLHRHDWPVPPLMSAEAVEQLRREALEAEGGDYVLRGLDLRDASGDVRIEGLRISGDYLTNEDAEKVQRVTKDGGGVEFRNVYLIADGYDERGPFSDEDGAA